MFDLLSGMSALEESFARTNRPRTRGAFSFSWRQSWNAIKQARKPTPSRRANQNAGAHQNPLISTTARVWSGRLHILGAATSCLASRSATGYRGCDLRFTRGTHGRAMDSQPAKDGAHAAQVLPVYSVETQARADTRAGAVRMRGLQTKTACGLLPRDMRASRQAHHLGTRAGTVRHIHGQARQGARAAGPALRPMPQRAAWTHRPQARSYRRRSGTRAVVVGGAARCFEKDSCNRLYAASKRFIFDRPWRKNTRWSTPGPPNPFFSLRGIPRLEGSQKQKSTPRTIGAPHGA